MLPRGEPRRGRATNRARGPRGRDRNARLQDEGSQHDGNLGGIGARFEQEENNPGGNDMPNQFTVDFIAALVAANILNQPRVNAESRAWEITKDFFQMNPPRFDGDKFKKLKQGTMTISEYTMQYQTLSRFGPELMNTEGKKCNRFEKGLHSSVRRLVMSIYLRVFIEVLELARTLKLPRDNVRNVRGNEER
ncbi:Retrotransposon gag domain-containing protein [Actinidia chinensis var. chinensis]|uniref:Retrotransposon gag domain-containing protein n=1 Tax=Actinidia chinensis var. chinensis TaxID=1590841 RepID=A0A2R6RYB3_ACTCC|nr:Retrotransposon gag domain-containing protein [Actinidia chinensis var. chinensis]